VRRFTFVMLMSTMLVAVGTWFGAHPSAQSNSALEASMSHFKANRQAHGLSDPAAELRWRRNRVDRRGVTHVKFDQLYRGLPVFEGEAITHVEADGNVTVTDALAGNLSLSTQARITRAAAVDAALGFIRPIGDFEIRDASLWILPRGERSVVDRLVWHVAVAVENDLEEPAEWRYFVDAQTGSVVWSFDNLETTDVAATARTMYSGNQAIHADFVSSRYLLRDLTKSGTSSCDMNSRTSGTCTIFSRTTAVFGNNSKSTSDRATAGADAQFGLQATWNFYRTTFGRNGINGSGRQTFSRVHYGVNYENAFWSNACFCMTYGDGATTFYPLVSVDVAGHEMSHGVLSTEANLTYAGESGGLNESNSDIFGTLVEFSVARTGNPDAADYWIGERILRANYSGTTYNQTRALRYMDDPARDGRSPACWSSGIGQLNVHYSSGPNNHMFYLLSNGGTSRCNGQAVTGIGRDKAGRIWYKAIADFMTASTNYHGARTAALNAATTLYGTGSVEYNAVAAAYSAINVN
jgi:zinc metalloprotease ZmpA